MFGAGRVKMENAGDTSSLSVLKSCVREGILVVGTSLREGRLLSQYIGRTLEDSRECFHNMLCL